MRRYVPIIVVVSLLFFIAACGAGTRSVSPHRVSRLHASRGELVSSLRMASDINLPPLPADCIPSSSGSQPQIGVYATFTGTATIKSPYGPIANANLSGSVCGIATVINTPPGDCNSPAGAQSASLGLNLPADGVNIVIPAVNITMIPNLSIPITHISVVPTAINATVCAVAAPGPIKQTVTASLPADAQIFGGSCVLTATVPVSVEIYGPLSGFTISGTNLPFTIPPLQPSPSCPSNVTSVADKLLALPLAQPANEITITGTGLAYQP
ncbi:MAG: hypothetical protein WAM97_16740 [Acidimicrobiales bacterium]